MCLCYKRLRFLQQYYAHKKKTQNFKKWAYLYKS